VTPKQEAFAHYYVEIGNASEAYRLSYRANQMQPETVHREAHELLKHPKISARVIELRHALRVRHDVTVNSLTAELEEARAFAMQYPKGASAAVSAVLGKARLHGFLSSSADQTLKQDHASVPGKVSRLELARRIAFLFAVAEHESI